MRKQSLTIAGLTIEFVNRDDSMDASPAALLAALKNSELLIVRDVSKAGDVDRCAETLDNLHGEAAVTFWKAECRRLADELAQCGLASEAISERVLDFQATVQTVLVQRHQARALAATRAEQQKKRRIA
jgi:hypothetical protein